MAKVQDVTSSFFSYLDCLKGKHLQGVGWLVSQILCRDLQGDSPLLLQTVPSLSWERDVWRLEIPENPRWNFCRKHATKNQWFFDPEFETHTIHLWLAIQSDTTWANTGIDKKSCHPVRHCGPVHDPDSRRKQLPLSMQIDICIQHIFSRRKMSRICKDRLISFISSQLCFSRSPFKEVPNWFQKLLGFGCGVRTLTLQTRREPRRLTKWN